MRTWSPTRRHDILSPTPTFLQATQYLRKFRVVPQTCLFLDLPHRYCAEDPYCAEERPPVALELPGNMPPPLEELPLELVVAPRNPAPPPPGGPPLPGPGITGRPGASGPEGRLPGRMLSWSASTSSFHFAISSTEMVRCCVTFWGDGALLRHIRFWGSASYCLPVPKIRSAKKESFCLPCALSGSHWVDQENCTRATLFPYLTAQDKGRTQLCQTQTASLAISRDAACTQGKSVFHANQMQAQRKKCGTGIISLGAHTKD